MASKEPDSFELQVQHRAKMRSREPIQHEKRTPEWLEEAKEHDWGKIALIFKDNTQAHIRRMQILSTLLRAQTTELASCETWKRLRHQTTKAFLCFVAAKRRQLWERIEGLPNEIQLEILQYLYATRFALPHLVHNKQDMQPVEDYCSFSQASHSIKYMHSLAEVVPTFWFAPFLDQFPKCDLPDDTLMGPNLHAKYIYEWYKHTEFHVNASVLRSFLATNPWSYSFFPMDLIRKLHIDITYNSKHHATELKKQARLVAKITKALHGQCKISIEISKCISIKAGFGGLIELRAEQDCELKKLIKYTLEEAWPEISREILVSIGPTRAVQRV